jgi:hypothetical protein
MRIAASLCTMVLALGAAGCGDGGGSGSGPGQGGYGGKTPRQTRTQAGSPAQKSLGAAAQVRASGKLSRAAVVAGGDAVEAVVLEDCLDSRFAAYFAAAPPCRPVAHVVVLPKLTVRGGENVEIDTGAQAGAVDVRVADTRGDPAAKEFVMAPAKPLDSTGTRWSIALPADVAGADRMDMTVSPASTDSGQVSLAIRLTE